MSYITMSFASVPTGLRFTDRVFAMTHAVETS
jgi:hypothetical protein